MAFNSSLRGSRRKLKSEINVVPYIDVMLVLLIIFMAVPPTQNPSEIKLPSAERSTQPPDDYIQIAIRENAQLQIGITARRRNRWKTCRAARRSSRACATSTPSIRIIRS
jgi:biopolymer transport protein TolR